MKPEKQIILLAVGILLVSLFFLLPRYQLWGAQRILPYWQEFQKQKNHLDPEYRRVVRYESSYKFSKLIAAFFERKGIKQNVLVLLPPASYFKKYGLTYPVPEPAVFYYYTGLKTVWVNSAEAGKANWYVRMNKGSLIIDSISDRSAFSDTLRALRKFPVNL